MQDLEIFSCYNEYTVKGNTQEKKGKKKMKRTSEYFEIKSQDDMYGLGGSFESAEKALEEINRAYEYAKTRGFDNKGEKWVIVCNQGIKEFDEKGSFLKEERTRFVVENVEYSFYENAFVFVY